MGDLAHEDRNNVVNNEWRGCHELEKIRFRSSVIRLPTRSFRGRGTDLERWNVTKDTYISWRNTQTTGGGAIFCFVVCLYFVYLFLVCAFCFRRIVVSYKTMKY